jgi:hypothetical protein
MNRMNISLRDYSPLLLFLAIAVCTEGRSEEKTNGPPSGVTVTKSVGLPGHVTAPAYYRVLTDQEIMKLFRRPSSASELLSNLQIVWEKNLLAQPAFYEEDNLMKVFNGAAVTWKKPLLDDSGEWSYRNATISLATKVFPNATVRVVGIRHIAKAESLPARNIFVPAYIENKGEIRMELDSLPGFTWDAIESAFGPGAEDQGPPILTDGGTDVGSGPHGNMWMRYLHSGEDPTKFGSSDRPEALFVVSSDRIRGPAAPYSRRLDKPEDSDEVKSFRISDSLTQYTK